MANTEIRADDTAGIVRALIKDRTLSPAVVGGRLVGFIQEPDYSLPKEADIVGYLGCAEMLCIECVRKGYAEGNETAEQALNRVARERGIDRSNECNYDSSQLPKPLTNVEKPELCAGCLMHFGADTADFRRCPDEDCGDWVTGASGPGRCRNCGHEFNDSDFEGDMNE